MTLQPLLARQPIVDRQLKVAAYELLFRGARSPTEAMVTDDSAATATVIANVFTQLGVERVLGPFPGYLNFGVELLHSDLPEVLPADRVVLEILETVPATPESVARVAALRAAGFRIALDDVLEIDERALAFLPHVQVVKLDLLLMKPEHLRRTVETLAQWPVEILAEKVDSQAQADECMALGFHLFQGYFFAKPMLVSGRKSDPSKLALLKLMSMLAQDAHTTALEDELKRQPNLTYNLLRIVNSVASGLSRRVDSVRQAVVVLGRRELARWVQLLLYASKSASEDLSVNPLLRLAAGRGRLMETLVRQAFPRDKEQAERAFMTGVLSLLDALLGVPLQDVLGDLPLHEDVRRALMSREGPLGTLLNVAVALEHADEDEIEASLSAQGSFTPADLDSAAQDTFTWVNGIGTAA